MAEAKNSEIENSLRGKAKKIKPLKYEDALMRIEANKMTLSEKESQIKYEGYCRYKS